MPAITGSFSGKVRVQTAISVPDQLNHELNLAEIAGTQKSPDEKWNNAAITYWGITDLVEGRGTQLGYFVNVHGEVDRDWGTFEGRVATTGGQITVEGTWQFTGGDGKFKGLTGGGTFKTRLSSPTQVEASWQGNYELATVKAQAR
jgi:hypothetical protein